MALVDMINAANTSVVGSSDPVWFQFILDHLDFIAANSNTFSIAPTVMHLYKYDLKRFLKEQMQRNEDIAWIVLLLNDLKSDFDFDTPGNFVIPTDRFITQLYTSYMTITSNTIT